MSLIYLDSSVALRTILDVPERIGLQQWMQTSGAVYVSSRLLRTEVIRVLRRDGRLPSEAAPLFDRVGIIDITPEIHALAESFERHIQTLDALHLATALIVGEPITVASHDTAMKSMAEHLGLDVLDPVEMD